MRKLVYVGLILAGCGTTKDEPIDTVADVGASDAASEVDMAPAVMCPNEGQLFCDGKCREATFDLDHCGACGNSCTRGSMTCMAGECLCLRDSVMCDGECYDLFASREHCGDCDTTCSTVEACVAGECIPVAEDPQVLGVMVATNEGRAEQQDCGEHGVKPAVGPVTVHELLTIAAQGHAEDMAAGGFLEHEGSNGSSPAERAADAGYMGSAIGENIARGYDTPPEVVAGWIDSDGHCKNMMNGDFNELGVGYAESGTGEPFWVQLFGRR